MARIEVPVTVLNTTTGLPVNGASVAISHRSTGAPATWYTAETGGTASTASAVTDASGRVLAWTDRGAYNLTISGTGLTTYTEPWDAAPASDGAIDTLWLPDGGVTNAKLASGIDASKLTTGTLPSARIGTGAIASSQIADGTIAIGDLAAGVGSRLLGGFELSKFSIGNNSDLQIGTGVVTHNGKGGFAVLMHNAHHNDSSWSGQAAGSLNMWFRIKRAGVTVHTVDLDPQFGQQHASGHGFHSFGTLSGAVTWSVTVGIGNIPVTLENHGRGVLLVFENY